MKRLQSLANKIWLRPDLLKSFKAIVAIVLVAFPFIFSGHFQFGISLILGVIAAGVAETEDPRGLAHLSTPQHGALGVDSGCGGRHGKGKGCGVGDGG